MELKGRLQDGSTVDIMRTGPPLWPTARASEFAIYNGEHLVRHPDDTDNTFFLTALTRREVRLLKSRE